MNFPPSRLHPSPSVPSAGRLGGALFALLIVVLLAAPVGFAQIGAEPATVTEPLGGDPLEAGGFALGDDFTYRVIERGGLVYAVEAEGTFDDDGRASAARLVAIASGFGSGIEGPVREFLDANLGDLAGRGPSRVAVEQYVLELDIAEGEAPLAGSLRFALREIDAADFPEPAASLGPADARYVIREFSDFQCPFCAQYALTTLEALKEELLARGDVRFEYHHFPLQSIHPNAVPAAEASECVIDVAGADAFWPYHDVLFEEQAEWQGLSDPDPYFASTAGDLGFDADAVGACLEASRFFDAVIADYDAAVALRLSGTPTLFVDGFRVQQPQEVEAYRRLFELVDAFGQPDDDASETTP